MSTFREAAQAKNELKMNLSNYAWYKGITIFQNDGEFCLLVAVSKLNNGVRKIIPQVINGFSIKIEVEN